MAVTTKLHYKVIDLHIGEQGWGTQLEDTINQQAQDGWELVTVFEHQHEAQQVGSGTVHLPALVTVALIFKEPA